MMTQQLGFSVLTAPIAAIDRRALSQAWYSALHLAKQPSKHDTQQAPVALERCCAHRAGVLADRRNTHLRSTTGLQVHREMKPARRDMVAIDRRSLRSPLARKIEYAFLRPNLPATRAAFTIDGTRERVHVTMQRTRTGLQLVAVCQPSARERVARALEQARYALAERGISIDARITE
ncbi:MAG: hypothetical protein JO322_10150 [Candidatus Eremiobacteraeota bacterium]|nr:hypothetical protein [Candidatus Eremiobacteraeota bacterium]